MTATGPLDELGGTEKIGATPPIGGERKLEVPTQPFSSYMEQTQNATLGGSAKTPLASPFEIAAGQTVLPAAPNVETIKTQVTNAQSTLGDINTYLNNPNLKLKQSSKYLLKNKLQDSNTHIRTAATRLGAQVPQEQEISQKMGPITRFVNYVTNGQNLLDSAKSRLNQMKDHGESMKPADFLLIQVQLNLAQQSLEYSSVVLSKAMDGIKQMMSIQL